VSALERARAARRVLLAAVAASMLLHALAAAAALLLLVALADRIVGLPLALRQGTPLLLVTGALAAAAFRAWAGRGARELLQVALFLERLRPGLQFSLVTAVAPGGPVAAARLEHDVAQHLPPGSLGPTLRRALFRPLAILLAAAGALLLLPGGTLRRVMSPEPGDALTAPRAAGSLASRLAPLVVEVVPPRYAGLESRRLDDPLAVEALEGSTIRVRGRGAGVLPEAPLAASVGAASLPVQSVADTWSVVLPMPSRAAVLTLSDREHTRLLTLEPVPDAVPVVVLDAPVADSTWPRPSGVLRIDARARDDLGLGQVWLELMLTTGGGERFSTTTRRIAERSPQGRDDRIVLTIRLDTMGLGPGDVLNIRAIARDRNDRSGPGVGSSDTRTIRIADPEQRDAIPIIPASAATLDTTVLSQRMLIIRAETLQVRRRRMPADSFVAQARRLGERQRMLYDRVQALILELETATDVGFVGETEESLLLRQAGIAMRQAEDQLIRARVDAALPAMYRALEALDKGRTSRRLYLRGMLPRIIVDLDQVRLKGTGTARVGPRDPRAALHDPRQALLGRLEQLGSGGGGRPPWLGDSLVMLRVEALSAAPEAAPALAEALEALRAGNDPLPALVRARRLLERPAGSPGGLSRWRGAP
jgi:hypothetical protein